ncbi:MAG: glycosyltransferase, partial [Sulfobacillus sp.]
MNRFDFIDNIVRNLDKERFTTSVVTFSGVSNIQRPDYALVGIQHTVLDIAGRRSYPRAARSLAGMLRAEEVDILHVHHFEPALIGAIATTLCPRTKLVVGRHYSIGVHTIPNRFQRRAFLEVESFVNRSADRIVVPSTMIRDLLADQQGVPAEKIDLIPYAFDPAKFSEANRGPSATFRETLFAGGEGPNGLLIGTFGRINAGKGHRLLFQALRSARNDLPNFHCLVVGDGPDRVELSKEVCALGLEDVVSFLGWRTDVVEVMSACDIVVQPTLHEAFSQTMIEALWLGKPLIMSDVSGASDVIIDGDNGLLTPAGNVSAIASALVNLANDDGVRATIGKRAASSVRNRLSIASIVPHFERLYATVVGVERDSNGPARDIDRITLVVPVRNEEATVVELAAAIHAQRRKPDEIIFVDGGSTDTTIALIREAFA